MRRRSSISATILALALLAAACSDDAKDQDPVVDDGATESVGSEAAELTGSFGELLRFDRGMRITLSAPTVQEVAGTPTLVVPVDVFNGGGLAPAPIMGLRCSGGGQGGWLASSSYDPTTTLGALEGIAGEVHLVRPLDGPTGTEVDCTPPAAITVGARAYLEDEPSQWASFPLDDAVVTELNQHPG